jgi:cytochrome c oxidase cbb3-type subunit IV
MFKYYFEQIKGIDIYPIISLTIFFTFFIILLIWVIKVDKKYISKMSGLPLEGSDSKNTTQNTTCS